MKTIHVHYSIERDVNLDFEVPDEVFDEYKRTHNDEVLGLDWDAIVDECESCYGETFCEIEYED